ncbi:hypothetical protein [Burkholderia sp. Ac-20344]|uniref:hypothetical protein n=1 Tax=Burkholderia sp. Ac-20344 TaxID=2703890 RepID=UPI00197BC07F|nr:hypothetical protein [Burkholderia sp. Ac-20344]MBN3830334.1 hypothetical protein [Burkholderia sp. Ac-20344]
MLRKRSVRWHVDILLFEQAAQKRKGGSKSLPLRGINRCFDKGGEVLFECALSSVNPLSASS